MKKFLVSTFSALLLLLLLTSNAFAPCQPIIRKGENENVHIH
jgi:hypothetical protein